MAVHPPAPAPVDLPADTPQPLLTYVDDATGERTVLTAAQLGEWAARSAGLLRDGCGLGPGSRVAVLLPPHWRTAAVLLGAWSVGMAVSFRPRATAGLPVLEPGGDRPYDAVFVAPERLDDWLEDVPEGTHRYLVGTGPGSLAEVPVGWLDWSAEVLRHPATPPDYRAVHPADPATPDGTSYGAWRRLAAEVAGQLDLRTGDRLLVDAAEHEQPLKWLLAPPVRRRLHSHLRQPHPGPPGHGRHHRTHHPHPLAVPRPPTPRASRSRPGRRRPPQPPAHDRLHLSAPTRRQIVP